MLVKTTLPKCKDCGAGSPRVVGNETAGYVWLCASCEVLRANPNARLAPLLPRERRPMRLQSETLF